MGEPSMEMVERAAFEKWVRERYATPMDRLPGADRAWAAWQARASLRAHRGAAGEPVAWGIRRTRTMNGKPVAFICGVFPGAGEAQDESSPGDEIVPLYASPPAPAWSGEAPKVAGGGGVSACRDHSFPEEQEPSGRLILAPCLTCGLSAMDGMAYAQRLASDAHRLLRLVLPLAKGYAAAHPVGSNAEYVREAECALYEAEGRV